MQPGLFADRLQRHRVLMGCQNIEERESSLEDLYGWAFVAR